MKGQPTSAHSRQNNLPFGLRISRIGLTLVCLSAGGLMALAVMSATIWKLGYYAPIVWPVGTIMWLSLANLVLLLGTIDSWRPVPAASSRAFAIVFMVWAVTPIGVAVVLLFGVERGEFDVIAMIGVFTLSLVELGFAGILERTLKESSLGRAAWRIAVAFGVMSLMPGLVLALFFLAIGFN